MTDAATVDPLILVEAQHHLKWLAGIRTSVENSLTSRFPVETKYPADKKRLFETR